MYMYMWECMNVCTHNPTKTLFFIFEILLENKAMIHEFEMNGIFLSSKF